MHRPAPVDLIVLSGFLGSGKTSLLMDFLSQEEARDTGVIVNEVGEIGVDGAIVADGTDNVPMTLLANGCVCCSLRSNLVQTVSALLDAPRPAGRGPLTRIILETSGLSRPGPIIASLADPELSMRGLRVSVVTTYDCQAGALRDAQFDEAAAQFAAAQRIVLTKVDTVSADELTTHHARAAAINPLAQVVASADRAEAVRQAFADLPDGQAGEGGMQTLQVIARPAGLHHPRIQVLKGCIVRPLEWAEFSEWLDDLAGLCGDRLLRLKAIVRVTDCEEPVLIQSVGTTFGMPRRMMTAARDENVLIVIVRDILPATLHEAMRDGPIRLVDLASRK